MDVLELRINELREARQYAAMIGEIVNGRRAALEATPEWRNLQSAKDAEASTLARVKAAEAAVRERALRVHAETGDKKPGVGVQIVMVKRFVYEAERVIEWAQKDAPTLVETKVILNARMFEKMLVAWKPGDKALPGEVLLEPAARIDGDLRITPAAGVAPAEIVESAASVAA